MIVFRRCIIFLYVCMHVCIYVLTEDDRIIVAYETFLDPTLIFALKVS